MKKGERHVAILSLLGENSKSSKETRKAIILAEGDWLIKFLSEVAMNILSGSLTVSKHYKKLLSHHAALIRKLGRQSGPSSVERRQMCASNADVISLMITATQQHIIPLIKSDANFIV